MKYLFLLCMLGAAHTAFAAEAFTPLGNALSTPFFTGKRTREEPGANFPPAKQACFDAVNRAPQSPLTLIGKRQREAFDEASTPTKQARFDAVSTSSHASFSAQAPAMAIEGAQSTVEFWTKQKNIPSVEGGSNVHVHFANNLDENVVNNCMG